MVSTGGGGGGTRGISGNATGDGRLDVPVNTRYNVFNGYRDVANLADNHHYESFGGDILGRRALVHITYSH